MLQHNDSFDDASRIASRESLWRNNSTTQFVGLTEYEYGDDDQLTDEIRDWEVDAMWEYDENGNRVEYANGRGGTTLRYSEGRAELPMICPSQMRVPLTATYSPPSAYYANLRFRIFQDGELEMGESFKIHLRRLGAPESAIELEAKIVDSNLVPASGVYYAYDFQNRLVRRTQDDGGPGENHSSDTFYSYQDGQVVLQLDRPAEEEDAALSQRYFWNPLAVDQLFAAEQVTDPEEEGDVLWALADHLGTIRDLAVHDTTTTIENHRFYDSFGNLQSESNSAIDLLFGYTGRQFDETTGLQYNLNRWYDAKTGRWISEDPIGFAAGDPNLNRYVSNQPTLATDPSGLKWRGPSSLSIYLQDYQYFVDPAAMPAKADFLSYCAAGGKYIGWGAFYGAGSAAIFIQTGGMIGLFPGGAGTVYIGGGAIGAGTVTAGTIGVTAGTSGTTTGVVLTAAQRASALERLAQLRAWEQQLVADLYELNSIGACAPSTAARIAQLEREILALEKLLGP